MVECKCCGKSISPNAQACPQCGEPSPAPPPPPPPLTFAEVLKSTGLDWPTLLAGIGIFLAVGLATWTYQGFQDSAANRAAQERSAQEKARQDEEFVRRVTAPPQASSVPKSAWRY